MIAVQKGLSSESVTSFDVAAERAVWEAFRAGCVWDDVVAAQMSGVEAA